MKKPSPRKPGTTASIVARAREQLGLGIRAFAEKLGVSASYLCDIEKGRRDLTIELAYAIQELNPRFKAKTELIKDFGCDILYKR